MYRLLCVADQLDRCLLLLFVVVVMLFLLLTDVDGVVSRCSVLLTISSLFVGA